MIGRRTLAAAAVTAALTAVLSGCGSGAPSEKQLVAKLRSDTAVAGLLAQEDEAFVPDSDYTCLAQALIDDAQPGDLEDYVHGTKRLDQVATQPGQSPDAMSYRFRKCLRNAGGGVSSP